MAPNEHVEVGPNLFERRVDQKPMSELYPGHLENGPFRLPAREAGVSDACSNPLPVQGRPDWSPDRSFDAGDPRRSCHAQSEKGSSHLMPSGKIRIPCYGGHCPTGSGLWQLPLPQPKNDAGEGMTSGCPPRRPLLFVSPRTCFLRPADYFSLGKEVTA